MSNDDVEELKCPSGFSNQSDWVISQACSVNDAAITGLWSVVLALYTIELVYEGIRIYRIRKRLSRDAGRTKTNQNKGLNALILYESASIPCGIILACLRLFSSQLVGIDLGPSIMLIGWRSTFYITAFLIQPFLLSTLLGKNSKTAQEQVERSRRRSLLLLIFNLSIASTIVVAPLTNERDSKIITLVAYFVLAGIAQLIYASEAFSLRRNVIVVLDESYKQSQRESILDVKVKLETFQSAIGRQAILQAIIQFVFSLPFMWDKFTYLLPIIMIQPLILFHRFVSTMYQQNKKSQSSSSGNQNSETMSRDEMTSQTGNKPNLKMSTLSNSEQNWESAKSQTDSQQPSGGKSNLGQLQITVSPTKDEDIEKDGENRVSHKSVLPSPARIMRQFTPSRNRQNKRSMDVSVEEKKNPHRREDSFSDVKFFPDNQSDHDENENNDDDDDDDDHNTTTET